MASNLPASATCNICSKLYADPRLLPCLHSFCRKCLLKILKGQNAGNNLNCPTCKRAVSLPEGDIDSLPKDLRKSYEAEVAHFASKIHGEQEISCDQCVDATNGPATMFCAECCEFLCKACTKHHKSGRKTLSHELTVVGGTKAESERAFVKLPHKPISCPLHEDEILKFFCETCTTLICRDCMAIEHSGHTYDRAEKVAEKHKEELRDCLKGADGAQAALEGALVKGGKVTQTLQCTQKSIEDDIKATFKTLIETFSKREKSLLAKAAEVRLSKHTALTLQGENFSSLCEEISATCKMIASAIQTYTAAEMLSAKGSMTSKLEQLLKEYQSTDLEPCRSDMILSVLDKSELMLSINSFGAIIGGSCPSKTKTNLYHLTAILGTKRMFTITTCDENGQPFRKGGEMVKVTLSLMGSMERALKSNVVDNKDGTYSASFIPQNIGEHQLSITIESLHIKGSPFTMYVRKKKEYTSLSSSQLTFSLSSQPYDVAVDDNGDVYVALFTYHCIEVYDKSGSRIRTIGTAGTAGNGETQLHSPSALVICGSILYVAEYSNNRVKKLTTSGEFLSVFGSDHLNSPRGICLDSDGQIFVSCCGNSRICIFEADGTHIFDISDTSNLSGPWGIAFDQSGNLSVADSNTNTIKVFTPQGQYINSYNSNVCQPAGIAIDDEGITFIAEYYFYNSNYIAYSQFCVLNSQHDVVTSTRNFQHLTGITVDKEGAIYVCDYNCCTVYKY